MNVFWRTLSFALAGCCCFLSIPFIESSLLRRFVLAEPYHLNPVPALGQMIKLRNDGYGKGYYGASRGNGSRRHKGIDILAPMGSTITASKSGRVTVADTDKGYGLYVEIAHPDGTSSRYAHLSTLEVQRGQWVRRGAALGKCGKSGNADHPNIKPHLHYEIRINGRAQDPTDGLLEPAIKIFP